MAYTADSAAKGGETGNDDEYAEDTKALNTKYTEELANSDKRLKFFLRQGNKVNQRYLSEEAGYLSMGEENVGRGQAPVADVNLFYTNITTLEAMLYGSTPKVDVSREHADPDDEVARIAAMLFQRMLQADVEPSGSDSPSALRAALQDRLIPGMGLCRVRYEVETGEKLNLETGEMEEAILEERAPLDYVHWQDFRWGWARTWAEVPWIAFRSFLTREEVVERFGEDKKTGLTFKEQTPTGSDRGDSGSIDDKDNRSKEEKAEIWEIWTKNGRKVCWWSKGAPDLLDHQPDPLELTGFWPMPKPLMANVTTTLLVPKADYMLAQDIYTQVNALASRIVTITEAIKVVGVYDKSASDSVGRMLQEGSENTLIPVDNWAMFAEKGGLKGTIDWFPIADVVGVLSVLRGELTGWIELLYQQTGMSDVLRGGNTDQYTSDGTNQLKAKFGSIRVQALQDQFARFASDCEQLRAQVIAKHFSVPQIILQSSGEYLSNADKPLMMEAVQLMKSPQAKWRVSIKPETISMIDYAQLKSERTEFLTATATYIQSATSALKEFPEGAPMFLEMLQWGMAGFKGSESIEGTLDQAIIAAKKAAAEPQKPEDDGTQVEQMRQQGEMAKLQAKLQGDMQILQAKSQAEVRKIQSDHQANMQEIMAKDRADTNKTMTDLQADLRVIAEKLQADTTVEEVQSTMAIAEKRTELTNSLTEMDVEHNYNMAEINAAQQRNEGGDND